MKLSATSDVICCRGPDPNGVPRSPDTTPPGLKEPQAEATTYYPVHRLRGVFFCSGGSRRWKVSYRSCLPVRSSFLRHARDGKA